MTKFLIDVAKIILLFYLIMFCHRIAPLCSELIELKLQDEIKQYKYYDDPSKNNNSDEYSNYDNVI